MTEQNRNPDGTFAPEREPTFGREGNLNDGGYRSLRQHEEESAPKQLYPEPKDDGYHRAEGQSTEDLVRTAQAELQLKRTLDGKDGTIPVDVSHLHEPLPADVALDPKEAGERAAKEARINREIEALNEHDREVAEVAADLGVPFLQTQEQLDAYNAQQQPVEQPKPAEPTQSDHEAKLREAMENPLVRQAIESQVAQAQAAQRQYLENAQILANATLQTTLTEFPELANVSATELPLAFRMMAAKDPARAEQARAAVTRTATQLQHAQMLQAEQAKQHQAQAAAQWEQYRTQHDAEFLRRVPEMADRETRTRLQQSALEYAREELGFSDAELTNLYHNSIFRDHRAQRMLLDASRYRESQRAVRDAARNKSVPPVQRPGTATARGQRSEGDVRDLQNQLRHASGTRAIDLALRYHRAKKGR
jgi:hypothetical protein